MNLALFTNQTLSIFTILAQVAVVALVVGWFHRPTREALREFLRGRETLLAFVVALVATAGSLVYSDVIGYEPCKLCWFQRIFMYPLVILFGVALLKKDSRIADYALALAIPGALIAAYHYLLQLGIAPSLPCSAVGYSAECSSRFVLQFGYITIPLMAFSAFALIAALLRYGQGVRE
jgi:disulfide bond formation protein DsbB